jgi:hypothetical protein
MVLVISLLGMPMGSALDGSFPDVLPEQNDTYELVSLTSIAAGAFALLPVISPRSQFPLPHCPSISLPIFPLRP